MTGYCMKCKESQEMQETEQVTMKNGRPATRGKCHDEERPAGDPRQVWRVRNRGMYRIGKPS